MGRIHRYRQEDCLILNLVSTNTREGRVLQKLFERIKKIADDLDPKRTGTVFNELGDVFLPINLPDSPELSNSALETRVAFSIPAFSIVARMGGPLSRADT